MRTGKSRCGRFGRLRAECVPAGVALGLGLVLILGPAGPSAAAGPVRVPNGRLAATLRPDVELATTAGGPAAYHLVAMSGWRWPVAGPDGLPPAIARGFAPPATRYGTGHRGVDVVAPAGTPVLTSGAGVVAFAGSVAGRGVVSVDHGRLRTTYEPVEPVVRTGQAVGAGEVIGILTAGHPDCPVGRDCLHWGLRRGADYLDPLSLLLRPRSRLLPVWGVPPPAPSSRAVDGAPPTAQAAP